MSVPNGKGPRWAPRSGRTTRPAGPAVQRRYLALDAWWVAQARGIRFPRSHPLARAACHEANAAEYDRLADRAASLGDAAAWQRMADEEMAESITILAKAERRARAAEAKGNT